MRVKFELCHEGVNNNGDRFTKASLDYSYKTIVNKPINWEHGEPNIGVVTASSIEERNDVSYVVCEGEIWKYKYSDESEEIKTGYANGDIKVSMECYFPDCNFVLGDYDEVISDSEASDELRESKGGEYKGKLVSREFIRPFFGGVGVTATPADKEAVFLAAAKETAKVVSDKKANSLLALKLFENTELCTLEKVTDYWGKIHNDVYDNALANVVGIEIKEHEEKCEYCISKKEVSDILSKNKEEVKVEDTNAEEAPKVADTVVAEETLTTEDVKSIVAEAVKEITAAINPQEESTDEDTEISIANKRIEELEEELKNAKSENAVIIADNLGLERLDKLSKAGIGFTEEQLSDKKKVLGGMEEEVFASYFADITAVKKASASTEVTDTFGDIVPGSLNLEDDEDKTLDQKYTDMYSKE